MLIFSIFFSSPLHSDTEKANLIDKIESLRNRNRITKDDPSVYRVLFMGARG